MFRNLKSFGKWLIMLSLCTQDALPAPFLPRPLANHPGHVYVNGERIVIPTPANGKWELRNYEDQQVSNGVAGTEGADLGCLPTGWYRLSWSNDDGKKTGSIALSVLEPLTEPVSESSPVAIDAGLFYVFYRKNLGRISVSYGPEEVASLVALTGAGWIRDRLIWREFDYLARAVSEQEVPDLNFKACHTAGLRVLPVVFDAPTEYRLPDESGQSAIRKPPYQLDKIYAYFRTLGARYGDSVQEWETWNEPEGIGGNMLSYEIAAVQKAAWLGLKKGAPQVQSAMGMGRVAHPEHLDANGYLDFVDTYNSHLHEKGEAEAQARLDKLIPFHNKKPIWVTECSSGSFPSIPGRDGELGPDQARAQANSIPKLFARKLWMKADRIFYFYFFSYTEEKGKAYGLVQERNLEPRPGYNAFATVGRLLGSASANTRPLKVSGLPEFAEGYQFSTTDHGEPTLTYILWSNTPDGQWNWPVAEGSKVFDTIGRKIVPADGKIRVGSDPVFIVAKDSGKRESPKDAVDGSSAPCPVVMNAFIADRYKNDVGDYLMIPCGVEFALPLDIYHFGDVNASGTVIVNFPEAIKQPSMSFPVTLAPGEHLSKKLTFTLPRLQTAGNQSLCIKIVGDFGALGKSVLALDFMPLIREVIPQDICIPVAGAQDPVRWHANLIAKSEMKSRKEGNWTVFDWVFGPPSNTVTGIVWAAPAFPIAPESIPTTRPDGLAIDIRQISGPKLKLALNAVEKNGAAYIGFIDLNESQLRSEGGTSVVVPFSSMSNPTYRRKDDNGHLDIEDIRSIEIAAWTEPNSKVEFGFKDLRWVKFNYKN